MTLSNRKGLHISTKRKFRRAASHNHAALFKQALDLYYRDNQPDKSLRILFQLAAAHYKKAYGEIGIILAIEKQDAEKAEVWFEKAEKSGILSEIAAYEYGMLHYLNKDDWEKGLRYLQKAAEQGYELAYGDMGIILYLYKSDIDQAERCFEKAEEKQALIAPAAFHYGQLLELERNELELCKEYYKWSAEEDFDLAYEKYASILYLDKIDVDKAISYYIKAEKANLLSAPHAYNYGKLLIKEKNEVEKGRKYLDMAESDAY